MLIALGVTLLFGIHARREFRARRTCHAIGVRRVFSWLRGRIAVLSGTARGDPDQRNVGGVVPVRAVQADAI